VTVATITIGERLDEACVRALRDGIAGAVADHARVLVIEGMPGRFCLGMDFATLDEIARPDRLAGFAAMMHALLVAPIATFAVVDGPALGGGLGVAAACDVVLASSRAVVGLPEALYGLAPAIIRPALLGRLSRQQLRMLVATCHSRSAEEGARLGLIDEVVAVEDLATARARTIRQLRRANADSIAALRRWDDTELKSAIAAGLAETTATLARPAVRAAIASEDITW
jgi:enoyl-CoA hydratase/carnithine racemase